MEVGTTLRILLVDDNPDFLNTVRRYLNNLPGVQVVGTARSGEEAIRMAPQADPDLVLMDLVMPGMGGLQAAESLKHDYPQMRIILLTLHNFQEYRQAALKIGADRFISKSDVFLCLPAALRDLTTSSGE